MDVYLIEQGIAACFEVLTKDMNPTHHYVKHFKHHSLYEEAEVIIIQMCPIQEQLTMQKFTKLQLNKYRSILPLKS